jgi:hypothetical protein
MIKCGLTETRGFCILRLKGGDVFVDFEDVPSLDLVNRTWTVAAKGNTKYATSETIVGGCRKRIYLHRLILDFPELVVDHVDRNGLNNRRTNLRLTTSHGNWVNSPPRKRGKSKYKGISQLPGGRWRAVISLYGQHTSLGVYTSEEDAARAYDRAARRLFGPTAWLNCMEFPL